MVKYLLKKSYRLKNLKEIKYDDLWNKDGVFTTMWLYNKPQKILFFKSHIDNLLKSLKAYKIYEKDIRSKILRLIYENIDKKKFYNHLLRIALNKKIISISLRDKIRSKQNFGIKLVDYERVRPQYKNLKYKKILNYLSKINTSKEDVALCVKDKIFETGTSNLLFVKNNKIYSPKNKYYKGINLKFYEKKFRIIKKNIYLKELNQFDEILLIGSGKGVVSAKYILDNHWKRRKSNVFYLMNRTFRKEFKKEKYILNLI